MPECLLREDRICPADRTKKPTNASARSQIALSSARIHSGLDMCETSGGIAKGTHDLLPSRSMVSMCPWNGRGHDPDLGVGHYRASTYKKKRNQWGHSLMMVRAYLHPMLWSLTSHQLNLHIQTSLIGHQIGAEPLVSSWCPSGFRNDW